MDSSCTSVVLAEGLPPILCSGSAALSAAPALAGSHSRHCVTACPSPPTHINTIQNPMYSQLLPDGHAHTSLKERHSSGDKAGPAALASAGCCAVCGRGRGGSSTGYRRCLPVATLSIQQVGLRVDGRRRSVWQWRRRRRWWRRRMRSSGLLAINQSNRSAHQCPGGHSCGCSARNPEGRCLREYGPKHAGQRTPRASGASCNWIPMKDGVMRELGRSQQVAGRREVNCMGGRQNPSLTYAPSACR